MSGVLWNARDGPLAAGLSVPSREARWVQLMHYVVSIFLLEHTRPKSQEGKVRVSNVDFFL
jgi:hypothetical protein